MLFDGRGAPEVAAACALLSEGRGPLDTDRAAGGAVSTSCDLLPLIDRFDRQPVHVRQVAKELQRIAGDVLGGDVAGRASEEELRHALFTGYADRLARRRASSPDRVMLATGHGASLARESGVRDGDYSGRPGCRGGATRRHNRIENPGGQPGRARVDYADVGGGRASFRC